MSANLLWWRESWPFFVFCRRFSESSEKLYRQWFSQQWRLLWSLRVSVTHIVLVLFVLLCGELVSHWLPDQTYRAKVPSCLSTVCRNQIPQECYDCKRFKSLCIPLVDCGESNTAVHRWVTWAMHTPCASRNGRACAAHKNSFNAWVFIEHLFYCHWFLSVLCTYCTVHFDISNQKLILILLLLSGDYYILI